MNASINLELAFPTLGSSWCECKLSTQNTSSASFCLSCYCFIWPAISIFAIIISLLYKTQLSLAWLSCIVFETSSWIIFFNVGCCNSCSRTGPCNNFTMTSWLSSTIDSTGAGFFFLGGISRLFEWWTVRRGESCKVCLICVLMFVACMQMSLYALWWRRSSLSSDKKASFREVWIVCGARKTSQPPSPSRWRNDLGSTKSHNQVLCSLVNISFVSVELTYGL